MRKPHLRIQNRNRRKRMAEAVESTGMSSEIKVQYEKMKSPEIGGEVE